MRISDWSSDVCSSDLLSLGSDEVGEQLVDAFRIAGADTRFIWRSEGRRSPVLLQELDTMSGRHSFSFRCRDTFEEFPRYEPIEREQLRSAAALVAGWSVFYADRVSPRSEEHTSELQSLMRISYAVFCLKKKNKQHYTNTRRAHTPATTH